MIKILVGDMFKSEAQTLVNTVNCVGVMGKGIAADFKRLFPHMFEEYRRMCQSNQIKLGELTLYQDLFSQKLIINFPTKKHWKSPTLLKDIEQGLDYFLTHYKKWGVTSIAFPPLGCGSGGLSWDAVGPLMYEKLSTLDIPVEIYAPFGTSPKELTVDFLQERRASARKKGMWIRGTLTSGEVAVLEVLYRLQQERYAKPIGRTMYQKVCYVLDKTGLDTGFIFEKSSYGPFSSEAARALTIYANNNLTTEERLGKMFRLTVTANYQKIRQQYSEELDVNREKIDKAVDLLSRVKDTEQGETIATIIYAASTLTHSRHEERVSKDDILKYILDWKKRWDTDPAKKQNIKTTIDDLAFLEWVTV